MGEHRYAPVLPWVAKIQYGPEGEAAYAWVHADDGTLIGTFKTHHADLVVRAVNRDALFDEMVEALALLKSHYPGGINPGLDEAAARARAVLSKVREAAK